MRLASDSSPVYHLFTMQGPFANQIGAKLKDQSWLFRVRIASLLAGDSLYTHNRILYISISRACNLALQCAYARK